MLSCLFLSFSRSLNRYYRICFTKSFWYYFI
nr:MAG TPA: hypothetical protein [Bacteriophage sp.]